MTPPFALRAFGSSDLQVTPLCFGCAPLGGMPETFGYDVPVARALETLRAIVASPVNYIDTAASYGDGESERRIGLLLRELGGLPAGFVLATKVDRDLKTGDFSGEQMKRSLERSLALLGLDRLQIVFLHDPEHTTFEHVLSPGGPLEVLQQYQQQGVIDQIGIAGGPIDMLMRYVETGAFGSVITHNRYTLLNRSAAPLLDLAAQRGMAVLNAAPYGSGILAKGPSAYARYAYQEADTTTLGRAQYMEQICASYKVPLAAAALQFSLRDPRITSTIIGITRPERVAQTVELAQHPMPDDLWPLLDAAGYDTVDPEANRFQ